MRKRLTGLLLVLMMIVSCIPMFASAETVITQTYQSTFSSEQGKDNFRFVQFDDKTVTNLTWSTANSRWEAVPNGILKANVITPGSTTDVGYLFTAPAKGVVKLEGSIGWALTQNDGGDGVLITISVGDNVLWSQDVPFGATPSYDVEANVRKGDEIHFRVNCKKSNGYDAITWWPSVAYTAKAYSGAIGKDGFEYLERSSGELKELTYDAETDRFMGSDGVAFMSDSEMMPTDKCSMVTRYKVTEAGKYRVNAVLDSMDRRGSGNIIYVYKNNDIMWQQIVPGSEKGGVDVRFTVQKGDNISVEVKTNEFTGYNYGEWSLDIKRFDGSNPFSDATDTSGFNYGVDEEFTLSSVIESAGAYNTEVSAVYNYTKFPMTYNSSNKTWTGEVLGDATSKVTATTVYPANYRGDPEIDFTAPKSGILKFEGTLPLNRGTNGLVARIYVNDKEIWSNRVGGDVSVRYDEPIDTVYFVDDVNVMHEVNAGDKITFTFERWRAHTIGSSLNINDVKMKYVSGDMLSETTKWKIKQSTVIDTVSGNAYVNGIKYAVDVVVNDGITYISEADYSKIATGSAGESVTINGKAYIPVRRAAESNGKTVSWGGDRFVVIHDGISVFFGIPEFSEMTAALKGGDLVD